ncbi:MAG: OprD family outer membrane porin [Alphaproteobacteria bacterium]|nr:OprD family outer membrane porin [Alphaproteobacteria bacterium]
MAYRRLHRGLALALVVAMTSSVMTGSAWAQSERQEQPIPATPEEDLTAIQLTFRREKPPAQTLFPEIRGQLQELPAFLRDSTIALQPRSFYRDTVTNAPGSIKVQEAWAAGGAVSFATGRLIDVISGGAVLYTSLPLYAPIQYDGSGLLLPGQLGYAVVGELYGKVHLADNLTFTAGRHIYDTPYLGPFDTRMTPNTFYGYTLIGNTDEIWKDGPSLRYGAGYFATIKLRNTNVFQSMSRAAGANADNGVGLVGATMDWGRFSLGAVEYYCQDTLNIAYAEGKYGTRLTDDIRAILALQYADQRSTGANLLNGGSYFATNQVGARVDVGYQTGILTLGYSGVNPSFAMQNPWSDNPVYTNALIQSFQRAGEQAMVVGASYVFTPHGLIGIGASAFFYQGWTGTAAGPPTTESEWDFEVDWRPEIKQLSGFWLRLRYATSNVNQSNTLTTINEARVILNYSVKLY